MTETHTTQQATKGNKKTYLKQLKRKTKEHYIEIDYKTPITRHQELYFF